MSIKLFSQKLDAAQGQDRDADPGRVHADGWHGAMKYRVHCQQHAAEQIHKLIGNSIAFDLFCRDEIIRDEI